MNLYRGLNQHATIIATAPLVGMLGTVCGIAGSFRGICGNPTSYYFDMAGLLSEALYPAGYSLAPSVLTTWSRNYLTHRADSLLAETRLPR